MTENLTPKHTRCSLGGCPSVTRLDDGRLVIVGASAHDLAYREDKLVTRAYGTLIAESKIADDETVVVISPDLLADLPEILHLRSQVAKLKQALEPFKLWMDDLDKDFSDHEDDIVTSGFGPNFVTLGDLRRARSAHTE